MKTAFVINGKIKKSPCCKSPESLDDRLFFVVRIIVVPWIAYTFNYSRYNSVEQCGVLGCNNKSASILSTAEQRKSSSMSWFMIDGQIAYLTLGTLRTRNVSPERFPLKNRRFPQVKSRRKHPKTPLLRNRGAERSLHENRACRIAGIFLKVCCKFICISYY